MNDRRQFLRRAGAACTLALLPSAAIRNAAAQATPKVAPITMVINQSPWFDGFRQLVEQYRKETGNAIELDVNPYSGALDKIRNSHAGQTDDGWTILGGRSVPHTGGIRSHKTVTTAEFGTPTELLGTGIQSPCAVW